MATENSWSAWHKAHRDPSVDVITITGEVIKLDPRIFGSPKYVTTDCVSCPFFVPPEAAMGIAEKLRQYRNPVPRDHLGICCYYETTSGKVAGKALVNNPFNPTKGCSIGKEKIRRRAVKMRADGVGPLNL